MKSILLVVAIVLLASCSSSTKKIIVFGRGTIDINANSKTITVQDDGGADDKSIAFQQSSPLTLTIKKPSGDVPVTIEENGLYLVNAKKDTVIGILQTYDTKVAGNVKLSQEELQKAIDSLVQLTQNKNIAAANHHFFVLPFQAVKITDNANATIVPPFKGMPLIEQKGDELPEVYRFYNISEIRETIAKLQEFSK
jgi:hypothetical protein